MVQAGGLTTGAAPRAERTGSTGGMSRTAAADVACTCRGQQPVDDPVLRLDAEVGERSAVAFGVDGRQPVGALAGACADPELDNEAFRRAARRAAALIVTVAVLLAVIEFAAIPPLVTAPMIRGPIALAQTYAAEDVGLESERVTLVTNDGLMLAAYWVHVAEPAAVVVFVSGTHGPSVTAFLRAGVAHVQTRSAYVGVPIVAFGLSLGGATAINAKGETPAIDGVI